MAGVRPPDVIGPQAKPAGLTFRYKAACPMPPTMKGPCAHHAHTFCAGPALIRGEEFADWFRRFSRIFVASPRRVTKRALFGGCLILDNTPSIASIILDDPNDAMHAGDAKLEIAEKE